jgi:hypothetical protein
LSHCKGSFFQRKRVKTTPLVQPESPLDQRTTRTFKETEVFDLCTSEEEEENDDVKSLLLVSDGYERSPVLILDIDNFEGPEPEMKVYLSSYLLTVQPVALLDSIFITPAPGIGLSAKPPIPGPTQAAKKPQKKYNVGPVLFTVNGTDFSKRSLIGGFYPDMIAAGYSLEQLKRGGAFVVPEIKDGVWVIRCCYSSCKSHCPVSLFEIKSVVGTKVVLYTQCHRGMATSTSTNPITNATVSVFVVIF